MSLEGLGINIRPMNVL